MCEYSRKINFIDVVEHSLLEAEVKVCCLSVYDEQAWEKAQRIFVSQLHPNSQHIIIDETDHSFILWRRADIIVKHIKYFIQWYRSRR